MKKIFLLMALVVSHIAKSQVNKVTLQASGLTCSMCSNSINKALKTIDFVSEVDANVKTYSFEISFKPNSMVDFDIIRKKVEGAGFAVSAFYANVSFNHIPVKAGELVALQNQAFLFVNAQNQMLNGDIRLKIIDKGFVSAKEYKMIKYLSPSPQTYHVTL
jgi:copper chaperone CopZ